MKDLPHRYRVRVEGGAEGTPRLESRGLPPLETAAPAEFGGPGDRWSPETLFVGAVADCFLLTFRAVARASAYAFEHLACEGEGVLDRQEGGLRFTEVRLRARLVVPPGADAARGERLLEKAERGCLVSRSLACPVHLESEVELA